MIYEPSSFQIFPITQLLPNFWLGNCGDAEKLSVENPLGIEEVINVCGLDYMKSSKITYTTCEINDGEEIPEESFWKIVNYAVQQYQSDKRVLIHCAAGMSRSAALAAAIMHVSGVMSFEEAQIFIKRRRPIVKPHFKVVGSIRKLLKLFPYDGSY